jgi:outer membrane murein-binding lipoprotein Lpp
MRRTATVLVTTIVAATTLAGCGGSAYCDAVSKNEKTLNTFGQKRTNAAYANYAKVFADVGKESPPAVKKDWTALAKATRGIIAAQDKADIKLEDMRDTAKVKKLNPATLKDLNEAYEAFNATTKQRNAVVKNVLQECDIKLK